MLLLKTPSIWTLTILPVSFLTRSYNPMITTRDVSLKVEIKTLTDGGITIFNAWGKMISRIVFE
jgi:hypothetical protein